MTQGKHLVAEYRLNLKNIHAAALTELIATMLQQLNLSMTDLGAIAVSIGPGSFTGLRIGLSTAKGLALGSALPIVTVPTLLALAGEAPCTSGLVCPMLKSRATEYYYAVYQRERFVDFLLQEPSLVQKEKIVSVLPAGAMLIGQLQELNNDERIVNKFICAPEHYMPTACSIARLGYEKFKAGDIAAFETVEPMYFQEFIAVKQT